MIAAARRSLAYLTVAERRRYFMFVALRALTGLLDIVGIALIGLIASSGAGLLGTDPSKPATILGLRLPTFDETGLVWLVVIVLVVFVGKALIAIMLTSRRYTNALSCRFVVHIATVPVRRSVEHKQHREQHSNHAEQHLDRHVDSAYVAQGPTGSGTLSRA